MTPASTAPAPMWQFAPTVARPPSTAPMALLPDAVRIRRELHEIPEIGFELYRTQAYVLEKLAACRPDYLRKIALTGVKAVFYAENPRGTIAFRADMRKPVRSSGTLKAPM